jgi:hypothetical protein
MVFSYAIVRSLTHVKTRAGCLPELQVLAAIPEGTLEEDKSRVPIHAHATTVNKQTPRTLNFPANNQTKPSKIFYSTRANDTDSFKMQ